MKYRAQIALGVVAACVAGLAAVAWFHGVEAAGNTFAFVSILVSPYGGLALLASYQPRWRLVRAAAVGGFIALVPIGAWAWFIAFESSRLGEPAGLFTLFLMWAAVFATGLLGGLFEVFLGRFAHPMDAADVLRKAGAEE